MGKKRIISQAETDPAEATQQGATVVAQKRATTKHQVLSGAAHITVSYNNTIISITDLKGNVIAWSTAGLIGFTGTKKSTPYAANLVAKDCVEKARRHNLSSVRIVVRGIGPAREAAIRGLASTGLNITSIMDATPIPHNGIRRKKPRRV